MKILYRFFILAFALFSFLFLCACGAAKPDPIGDAAEAVKAGKSPDFSSLQSFDPSIIGWLYIPGTDINQAIYSSEAGIHIDPLNGDSSFSGPAVLLLGSSEGTGAPFRTLQTTYSTDSSLREASAVLLYTPQGLQTWQVFGAGAFRDIDILNIYDNFRNRRNIPWFVDQWRKHHTMIRVLDDSVSVTEDDRLLILSTELNQTPGQRFLVLALSADTAG